MDFIEGLPKSEGYSVILVAMDIFTKFAHFIPLKHTYTASNVASWTILSDYVAFPILFTDRDTIFSSISGGNCLNYTRSTFS